MIGNFGAALQMVILVVLTVISGLYIIAYASNVFVTIAQQTAGGLDQITWPKDPWYDWIGKAVHLLLVVGVWMVPLGLVLRLIAPESLGASIALYVGVPGVLFCLLFPITLLSSFSAGSPLALVRPEVLRRMARCSGGTFAFYLLSAPLCLAGAGAVYATLGLGRWYALPVLATVLFLYARLIGRYSRLLGRVRLKGAKAKVAREVRRTAQAAQVDNPWGPPVAEPSKKGPKKKKKKPKAKINDPWAASEESAAEPERTESTVEAYGLARDEPAPVQAKQAPPPVEGYDVSPEPPPARPKEIPLDGSPPIEEKRIYSEAETPLPDRPLVQGVFSFPWYPSNLGTWGLLTLLFLFWGVVYSAMHESAEMMK